MKKNIITLGIVLSIVFIPSFTNAVDIGAVQKNTNRESGLNAFMSSLRERLNFFFGNKNTETTPIIPKKDSSIKITDKNTAELPIPKPIPESTTNTTNSTDATNVIPTDDATNVLHAKSINLNNPIEGTTYIAETSIPVVWSENYNSDLLVVEIADTNGNKYYAGRTKGVIGKNVKYLAQEASNIPNGKYILKICDESISLCSNSSYFLITRKGSVIPADDATNVLHNQTVKTSQSTQSSNNIQAVLVSTNEDHAGPWYQFHKAEGDITKNETDWKWSLYINNLNGKTIKRITVIHNIRGEVWSTGFSRYLNDNTDLYGYNENPYPIVAMYNGKQLNTDYDQNIQLDNQSTTNGPYKLDLYGEAEYGMFTGGRLIVEYTDGTSESTIIPKSDIRQGNNYPSAVIQLNPINATIPTPINIKTPINTTDQPIIKANSAPTVMNISPKESTVVAGQKAYWNISAIDNEGDAITYRVFWRDTPVANDFTTNILSHTYTVPGNYIILFIIKDSRGAVNYTSAKVKVISASTDKLIEDTSNITPPGASTVNQNTMSI